MTIERQKTDLISRIAYYREELDRLGQFRLALGREALGGEPRSRLWRAVFNYLDLSVRR